jgi:hypothetical protein
VQDIVRYRGSARSKPRRRAYRTQATPSRDAQERRNLLVPAFVGLALLLGGASPAYSTYSFILGLLAAIAFAAGVLGWRRGSALEIDDALAGFALAFLALAFVHLIPLSPALWTSLPGRETIAASLRAGGLDAAWLPLSLDPQGTVSATLAALPVAALVALLRGGRLPARDVAMVVVAVALVSFLLGLLQIKAGGTSALYFHAVTNRDLAVGFFANANHLATLLLISVPLSVALAAPYIDARRPMIGVLATAVPALLAGGGIYATGSVAGLLLLVPTAAASLFLLRELSALVKVGAVVGAGVLFAAGCVLWLNGWLPLAATFNQGSGGRAETWATSIEAARAFWPVGGGLGSFRFAFPLFLPSSQIRDTYVNHVHNAFWTWWAFRSWQAWRDDGAPAALWRRAASIVIGVVLLHSAVDYPARTPAILTVFVFFCCVLGKRQASSRPVAEVA